MSQGPISDLFSQPVKPRANGAGVVAVVVLLSILGYLLWLRFDEGAGPIPGPDDQEQVEPAPKGEGKTLVFIHERNPQPIEHDLLLREMPSFCAERKLQFRALDDDLSDEPVPDLIAFAKSKGIDSPFVVLTNKEDKPWRVIAWPADKAGLGGLFK